MSYFETPDGQNCFERLGFWTFKAAVLGTGLGAVETLLLYHPTTYIAGIQRTLFWALPITGMGATIAATSCILINVRKKDDSLNYLAAGAAAGSIWGKLHKCPIKGLKMSAFLGILLFAKKYSVLRGWEWEPSKYIIPEKGSLYQYRNDYSLLKDPGPSVRRVSDGLR